jgi:hypothetical protein
MLIDNRPDGGVCELSNCPRAASRNGPDFCLQIRDMIIITLFLLELASAGRKGMVLVVTEGAAK